MNLLHRVAPYLGIALAGALVLGGAAFGAEITGSSTLSEESTAGALQSSTCYRYKRPEKKLARLTNGERTSRGLLALKLDPELSRVARFHAKKMMKRGELFHQSPAQLTKRVTNWQTLAENVGKGTTIRAIHRQFMKSDVHRANILDPIKNHVGAGVVTKNGVKWVTVLFESALDPGTTLTMPKC